MFSIFTYPNLFVNSCVFRGDHNLINSLIFIEFAYSQICVHTISRKWVFFGVHDLLTHTTRSESSWFPPLRVYLRPNNIAERDKIPHVSFRHIPVHHRMSKGDITNASMSNSVCWLQITCWTREEWSKVSDKISQPIVSKLFIPTKCFYETDHIK